MNSATLSQQAFPKESPTDQSHWKGSARDSWSVLDGSTCRWATVLEWKHVGCEETEVSFWKCLAKLTFFFSWGVGKWSLTLLL